MSKNLLADLSKLIYQIVLMIKSVIHWHQQVSLEECKIWIEKALQAIIIQIKYQRPPDFTQMQAELMHYRHRLTELRKQEAAKENPDFSELLDKCTCFYNYIKLLELLMNSSKNISPLKVKS